jgi:hypothetical protein
MTTLTENAQRLFGGGGALNSLAVIAAEIIYEHAAVGKVLATGLARPLAAGDLFVGFANEQVDNSAGSAAALNIQLIRKGVATLTVAGVVITDVGQPVYASDDDTFTMAPATTTVSNSFVGFVMRFKSAGVAEVAFNCDNYEDPYGTGPREMVATSKTLDILDTGKTFFVDTDAQVITLPATATPLEVNIVNGGAFGTVLVAISPNASDKIHAPDIAGTDNKDHLNTKATAQRGDSVRLRNAGDANGSIVSNQVGTWAQEA